MTIRPEGCVRLGFSTSEKLTSASEPVNSTRQFSPFKKAPPAVFNKSPSLQSRSCWSGASARALTPSTAPSSFGSSDSIRPQITVAGAPVSRETALKNAALRWSLSIRLTLAPGRRFKSSARTIPGKPAPEPRSAQRETCGKCSWSCAEISEMPRPDLVERRSRHEVDSLVPVAKHSLVDFELRLSLSQNGTEPQSLGAVAEASFRHARRARAASSVSAAGVTPSMRWAWARVRGRSLESRPASSVERPLIAP